jgi:hypothetical protein
VDVTLHERDPSLKPSLRDLPSGHFKHSLREVTEDDVKPSLGDGEGPLARPTPGIEDQTFLGKIRLDVVPGEFIVDALGKLVPRGLRS